MLTRALKELAGQAKAPSAAGTGALNPQDLAPQLAGLMGRQAAMISRLQEGVAAKSRHLARLQTKLSAVTEQLAAMRAQVTSDSSVLPGVVTRPFDSTAREELVSLHCEVASLRARAGRFDA